MAVHLNILSKFSDKGINKATKDIAKFTRGIRSVAGALGIGLGINALVNSLKEVGTAASEDVRSQALLAAQLKNTTGATNEQIAGIEKVINAMQMQVGIADDQLRPAYASLVRATGDVNRAQYLLALSADIAAGTGRDLASVSVAVGKAAAGQTTQLFRLIPSLRGAADWASEASKQFAGMAETAAMNDPFKQISIIFGEMQEQIGMKLLPYLQQFVEYLKSPAGQVQLAAMVDFFAQAVVFAGNLTAYIIENAQAIGDLTTIVGGATIGFGLLSAAVILTEKAIITASIALRAFKYALISTGIGIAVVAAGELAAQFAAVRDNANDAANAVSGVGTSAANGGFGVIPAPTTTDTRPLNPRPGQVYTYYNYADGIGKPVVWWETRWDGKKWSTPKRVKATTTTPTTTPTNPIADFSKNIANDIAQVKARLKLESMGASSALIEAILGSGDKWSTVYKDIVKGGESAVLALQARFNQTQAGLDEIAEKSKEAEDARQQALEAATDALREFTDQQQAAKTALEQTLAAVRELGTVTPELGQFEQAVTDSFRAVADELKSAFENGSILQGAYSELVTYARSEQQVLAAIGKNRDALAEKKSLVSAILSDVREAIVGNASIANFVEQQAKTVTEATTKIVGGLSVTTTRTLEVLSTQNNIVSGFQSLLTKTRTFVTNLKQLRALGLSTDLFKQIVDAGVDSGNATAEALIAGGAGTITEVNNLYRDIQEQAGIAAEETAQALYGQGIDLTKGIMAGIVSQETALVALADDLGNKFADAFATKVTEAIRVAAEAFVAAQQTDALSDFGDPTNLGTGGGFVGRNFNVASVGRATMVEQLPIQVNLTLDSRQVAQGLVKLEKQSGSIWVRA